MPWEAGVYFSKSDVKKAEVYFESQGLSQTQALAVGEWHRTKMAAQILLWSGVMFFPGIFVGFIVARLWANNCFLF